MFNSQGILRCARYAFMPNKLDLCGPDKNKDILHYCTTEEVNKELNIILKEFQVLYPYLKFIAHSNQIKDPFDERVIEAYWIGNQLLDNINKSRLYNHLSDEQQLKKKLNKKLFKKVIDKISLNAKPHHSFHVFSVLKRTGNVDIMHTLNSMDLCKISWGRIKKVNAIDLGVEYNPLLFENNKLKIGSLINHKVLYKINNSSFIKKPQVNQLISFHWDFACEILNNLQVNNLKKYTQESIQLANIA